MDEQETVMGNIGEIRPSQQPPPNRSFSKRIVFILMTIVALFTIAVLWLSWNNKTVPDSLIYSIFGVITGEFGVLGLIRVKCD